MEVSMRAKSFCEFYYKSASQRNLYGQISFQKVESQQIRQKCNTFNSHFDN